MSVGTAGSGSAPTKASGAGAWRSSICGVGRCASSGTAARVPETRQGVYGFTETSDGHVWAYGGTMHMDAHGSFIMAVDQEPITKLFELSFAVRRSPTDPACPSLTSYP